MWDNAFAVLRLYHDTRGNAQVGPRVRAHGVNLGKWVSQCRDDYWDGLLSPEHISRLESVDGWQWGPPRSGSWRHALHALSGYATQHGTTLLVEHTTVDGVDLQAWTSLQRQAYIALNLPATRVEMLEELPGWEWDAELVRWRQGLRAARLHIQRHGSLKSVDRETRLGDFRLGHWIQRCREDYRAGTLPADRVDELQALPGWTWGRPHDNWREGLHYLNRFVTQNGHASPPQHTVIDGYPIGWWVTQRRRQHRQGTLPAHWAHALESLPGWQWEPLEDRWRRGLTALHQYVANRGHASPARAERINGYPVGEWVRAQRSAHARGRLPRDRTTELAALPGWRWDSNPT